MPRNFYARPAAEVAPDLLGKILIHDLPTGRVSGKIVETEAYTGSSDPGSHAYRGPTPRNRVMFGPAGFVYVYLSYGMHFCMNVVTEGDGAAGAVLLRALEPVEGIPSMEARRSGRSFKELCNGPGKLCQALGLTRACNGVDLTSSVLWVCDAPPITDFISTTRVGLSQGRELPLRFYLAENRFVSPGKPSGDQDISETGV